MNEFEKHIKAMSYGRHNDRGVADNSIFLD